MTLAPRWPTDREEGEHSEPAGDDGPLSWRHPAPRRLARLRERAQAKWANRPRPSRIRWPGWLRPREAMTRARQGWLNWTRPVRRLGRRFYRDVRWWLSIGVTAVKRFDQHDGDMRAAAIAYYSLISLFPLILLLIVGLSYVLGTESAQTRAIQLLIDANVPTSLDIVRQSVQQIYRARAAVSALALVTFAWSALAVFSTIERAMSRIWDVAALRPYWRGKLMALLGIIAIGVMTVLSVTVTAGVTYIKNVILPFVASHTEVNIGPWEVLVVVSPYVGSILLFLVVYRIFPHTTLSWLDVWPGSLLAGFLWEEAKHLYGIYLTAFNRNSFVYGSVGTIIATMIWFYVTAVILLIGAEISATYTSKRRALRRLKAVAADEDTNNRG